MSDEEASPTNDRRIDRRRLLAGIGAVGMTTGFGPGLVVGNPDRGNGGGPPENGGGGPPEKCGCSDDTSFLAKYDFEDCEFVLAEGEDVIDITEIEGKDGDECEPIAVEYEADGFRTDQICAFGGRDTDTDEDPDGRFESDLVNPGGQQAGISNLTFCGEEEVEVDFFETVSLAYEDLPLDGGNDYDYNDWIVDVGTTLTGVADGDEILIDTVELEFTPQARGAGDTHLWRIVPGSELNDGTYTLTVFNQDGTERETVSDEYVSSETEIEVFDTIEVYPDDVTNAEREDDADGICVPPERTASLIFDLEDPWSVDPEDPIDEIEPNGEGLFFDPVLENQSPSRDVVVGIGDVRLLSVPTDWKWPYEEEHIANAYEDVGPEDAGDGDQPIFEADDWFERPIDGQVYESCRE